MKNGDLRHPPDGSSGGRASAGTTVLLADDNEDSRVVVATLLEFEGFRVLHAADGPSALRIALEDGPDLVLLNLIMPDMDGHQVLARLRSDERTSKIPCVVLTGDARHFQMGKALLEGADAFLTKPAAPRAVLETIRHLLAEGEPPDEAVT